MNRKHFKSRFIIVRCASDIFMPIALILGIYVILHGTVSPGGGFQGGVIVSSAAILMYLGHGYDITSRTFRASGFKKGEAVAAVVYLLLATSGIWFGASFCRNLFAGGDVNSLFGAGTISYMNFTVGFKVMMGISFLLMLLLGMLAPEKEEVQTPAELSYFDAVAPDRDDKEEEA